MDYMIFLMGNARKCEMSLENSVCVAIPLRPSYSRSVSEKPNSSQLSLCPLTHKHGFVDASGKNVIAYIAMVQLLHRGRILLDTPPDNGMKNPEFGT